MIFSYMIIFFILIITVIIVMMLTLCWTSSARFNLLIHCLSSPKQQYKTGIPIIIGRVHCFSSPSSSFSHSGNLGGPSKDVDWIDLSVWDESKCWVVKQSPELDTTVLWVPSSVHFYLKDCTGLVLLQCTLTLHCAVTYKSHTSWSLKDLNVAQVVYDHFRLSQPSDQSSGKEVTVYSSNWRQRDSDDKCGLAATSLDHPFDNSTILKHSSATLS